MLSFSCLNFHIQEYTNFEFDDCQAEIEFFVHNY